jgi:hypothetical protein
VFERYDFVVFTDARPFAHPDTDGLEPIFAGRRFELYRLKH